DRHLRFERAGNGFFAVLGDLHHELGATPAALDILRLYVDAGTLITIRQHSLKSIDRVRRDLEEGLALPSAVAVMNHLLQRIADSFNSVLTTIGDGIDDAEEHTVGAEVTIDSRELGRLRRLLARLRRHRPAFRGMDVESLLGDWCSKADANAFRQVMQKFD